MKNILQLVNASGVKSPYSKLWEALVSIDKSLDDLSARINAIKSPSTIYCRAWNDADVAIAHGGSGTIIPFNKTIDQNSNIHDNVNSNTDLTISEKGWYTIGAQAQFAFHADGVRGLNITLVRGATTIVLAWDIRAAIAAIFGPRIALTTEYLLYPRDIIKVYGYQSSGAPLNILTAEFSPIVWIHSTIK